MFRFEEFKDIESPFVLDSKNRTCTPIDQYDSQDFNINEAGWIRNDISQLARAQSLSEFNMIMNKLSIQKESGSLPEDMSIEDAIKSIRPR